ncbi:MAG: hypothetical protein U9Q07_04725, partial [Planctomycetota bacterium]|nr:hypothetical protein [Planctomycetota bacterium]
GDMRHDGFQMRSLLVLGLLYSLGALPAVAAGGDAGTEISAPYLQTDNHLINRAFRIGIGDLLGNVGMHQGGLLESPQLVILAGLDYGRPWTRDASVNAWNGASLIMPGITRNTLISVLLRDQGKVRIGGQYWDAMVWATGAWHHYLCTADRVFLSLALDAVANSLTYFEQTEFNAETGLFRGPGWSDGVAAYPGIYGDSGGSSAILDWPRHNPDKVSQPGYGIPMKALSTNCLYYNAYLVAGKMADELDRPADAAWSRRAAALKDAINQRFWMEDKGWYRFFVGPFGDCNDQEGLGHAYALLFGIANRKQAESIFENLHVTPAGFPCGWPTCPRYESQDGRSFGRHSGTVWPQIQGFWAEAAARRGKPKIFAHELYSLARHAVRDNQFAEIYHPLTGEIYGGMQEAGERGIILWNATSRQTWAATAFLRMVLHGMAGMQIQKDGIRFQPCLPPGVTHLKLGNLIYRDMKLAVTLSGAGQHVISMTANGKTVADSFLRNNGSGPMEINILMGNR